MDLLRNIYNTLREPKFRTGALVTAYAVLVALGLDLLIEYGHHWSNILASVVMVLGSLIALVGAWSKKHIVQQWESVGIWLLFGSLLSTLALEFDKSGGALRNVAVAAFLGYFIFAVARMITLKRDQGLYERYS